MKGNMDYATRQKFALCPSDCRVFPQYDAERFAGRAAKNQVDKARQGSGDLGHMVSKNDVKNQHQRALC